MNINFDEVARDFLEIKEGRNQLKVLSVIADYQLNKENGPRQKDIVDEISISKGAVSNYCKELELNSLVFKDDGNRYKISEDVLIATYREYIEPLFALQEPISPFELEMRIINSIKKEVKDQVENILEVYQKSLEKLILKILESAKTDRCLLNLREVFQTACSVLLNLGLRYLKKQELEEIQIENIPDLIKLSLSLMPKCSFMKVFMENLPQDKVINMIFS